MVLEEHNIRVFIISLQEKLDAFAAPALREQIESLFQEGISHFVIDLSHVPFFDSAGMAVFVSALKRARLAGGDVKLVWPLAEEARRIIYLTKFDRVFDISHSAEEAQQACGVA